MVDDALAVLPAIAAAAFAVKARGAARSILACPVGVEAFIDDVQSHYDTVVCLERQSGHLVYEDWYDDARQPTANEAIALLGR